MGGSGGLLGQNLRVEKLILIVSVFYFLTLYYHQSSISFCHSFFVETK